MTTFEAIDETVNEAAAACARRLAKWFGGIDEAIAALSADQTLGEIALIDYMKTRRQMTVAAHMNPRAVASLVLDQIR